MTEYNLGKVVGKGISTITKSGETVTVTYLDNTTDTFTVPNGAKGDTGDTGATGNGISSITKTSTSGLVDTYTITFTNGTTSTFTITNGSVSLASEVTEGDTTHAVTGDAVYNYISSLVGDIEDDMLS